MERQPPSQRGAFPIALVHPSAQDRKAYSIAACLQQRPWSSAGGLQDELAPILLLTIRHAVPRPGASRGFFLNIFSPGRSEKRNQIAALPKAFLRDRQLERTVQ